MRMDMAIIILYVLTWILHKISPVETNEERMGYF